MSPSAGVHERLGPALELLRERAGLIFPEGRLADVAAAVARGMARAGLTDSGRYLNALQHDSAALAALIADCTVGETYFFREPEQLAFIRREVLPALARRRPAGPVRAWSAGCASGEEAYTLAILLREVGLSDRARVLGTDIAADRLRRARRARYSAWSLRGLRPDETLRWFTARGRQFDLDPGLRGSVDFRLLNLAGDDYPSSPSRVWDMDLILCRNVLIYLDREVVAAVAQRLLRALAPGGWLFLGASDPPLGDLVECERVTTDGGVAYRAPRGGGSSFSPSRVSCATPTPPPGARMGRTPSDPAPAARPRRTPSDSAPAARPRPGSAPVDAEAGVAEGAATEVRRLADAGRLAEAARACAAALERHGASPELLHLQSLLLAQAGHHAGATAAARGALYLDPDLAVAHLGLGHALARMGDVDGARRAFRNAARLLARLPPHAVVSASGGETAARLASMATAQLGLLGEAAG